ncbi:hypothetical protein TcWFU_006170 [Taenia crassiceps]|uniref:Prominin-like protein n=1 Tax=Taenia crassiceps TaxID=6207 RepID=A0ABR4Q2S7_9CEST
MALHFSLLASVAAIMTWVIRTENGGLLNVLFRIVPSATHRDHQHDHQHDHDVHFELINQVDAAVVDFFKQMLLLKPLPLPILQVMPESLGGGQSGVDNAHANPNRGADIFWITVFTFLLVTGLITLKQVIKCSCFFCRRCCYQRRDMHGLTNALQMAVLRANITNKQFILRIVYIAVLLLTLVFLAISIILVIVYISSTGLVVSYLATQPQVPAVGNQTPASLPDGLHSTISHASAFLTKGIAMGRDLTNRTLHHFVDGIYTQMTPAVGEAFERLLAYVGTQHVLEKGDKLVEALKSLYALVFGVYRSALLLHSEVAPIEAKLRVLRTEYANALGNVSNCATWDLCQRLKNFIANEIRLMPSEKFDATLVEPYIERLHQTITTLSSSLHHARGTITELRTSTGNVFARLKSELNLTNLLQLIESFWNDTQSRADALLQQLNETVKLVETHLPKYVHSIRVGFHVVGGVFVVMLIIAALVATHLVYRSVRDRLFAHPSTVAFACTKSKWDNVVCGKSAVCCCSVLFIPLLLVFAAIVAVLLFLLTTVSSEGCIYLERESAVKMTDFVVNGYVARQWNPFIRSAVGGSAAFLNTSPPTNLLFALTQTCSPATSRHTVGLLSALGYHNLIDVPKFLSSRELTDAFLQGKAVVLRQVGGLDIARSLPDGRKVEEGRRTLSEALAKFKLDGLLQHTNPARMNAALLEEVLKGMEELSAQAIELEPSIRPLNRVLTQATEKVRRIGAALEEVHQSLQRLIDGKWDILVPLDEVISALNASRNAAEPTRLAGEVEKEYYQLVATLLNYMRADGEATFTKLTGSLFPCEDAHAAYNAAIGVTCGETGGVRLLLGLSYVLALNVLFLTLLYFALFSLVFLRVSRVCASSGIAEGSDADEADDIHTISKSARDVFSQ